MNVLQTERETISREHWQWGQDLIREVDREREREEIGEQIGSFFSKWMLAVKMFHKLETRWMIESTPDEMDFICHKDCVTHLISMGCWLEGWSRCHESAYSRIETIQAIIKDLENSLSEWHSDIGADRIENLRGKIFGAAA